MPADINGPSSPPLRVAKKLAPTQPGALKLARRYGAALVCVRYRLDAAGTHRYTTVELIVERAPVAKRVNPQSIVGVRIGYHEAALQTAAKANGATWDRPAKLWRMTHGAAVELGLRERIVEK